MQRQARAGAHPAGAARRHRPRVPRCRDSGDVVLSHGAGTSSVDVDGRQDRHRDKDGREEHTLTKFMRSNQGTLIHHKPVVRSATRWAGESATAADRQRRARARRELLVAFMPFEGYNFEDAIVIWSVSSRTTSFVDPHPRVRDDARSTKLGDEEITRDIPTLGGVARAARRRGVVRIGAEVGSGDLLVAR